MILNKIIYTELACLIIGVHNVLINVKLSYNISFNDNKIS